MKKLAALILALLLACSVAAAEEIQLDLAAAQTIGDIASLERVGYAAYPGVYVYAFLQDGVTYRAIALSDEDTFSEILALDWEDQQYQAKLDELTAPLPIVRIENLTEGIPTEEELNALVGRTGRELFEQGFTIWAWSLDTMEFNMVKGPYAYLVRFDGGVEDYNGFEEEDLNLMTVTSVLSEGIGEATALEESDLEAIASQVP